MGFDEILMWVEAMLGTLAEWVYAVMQLLYQVIVAAANFIWGALQNFWGWLDGVWEAIKSFFDDLWWNVIVPFIEWCQRIIDDVTTWLEDFLDPLISILQAIDRWYTLYVRPILWDIIEVIQRVRVVLAAFRIMGFKWAAKLDADLTRIQSWVTTVATDIATTLNQISTILNLAIDPTMILRRDFFASSLFSSLGAVKRAVSYGMDRPSTPDEQQRIDAYSDAVSGKVPLVSFGADGVATYSPLSQSLSRETNDLVKGAGMNVFAH